MIGDRVTKSNSRQTTIVKERERKERNKKEMDVMKKKSMGE